MTIPSLSGAPAGLLALAADHLWQSTLFACAAAAVAFALRKTQAQVRYGLWFAASLKFLLPFALLAALGSRFAAPRPATHSGTVLIATVVQASQPFTAAPVLAHREFHPLSVLPQVLLAVWLAGSFIVLLGWVIQWHRVQLLIRSASLCSSGRECDALRHAELLAGIRRPIRLLVSASSLEPGVFGILRPALIWPAGISGQLEDAHLAAIMAHEVCHVRRRDNLAALLHMFVQAAFWFHPLVWWLGAKLVEERERACDEAVLHLGNAPGDYAESILKACKFCIESPLPCVSGVSGSDLKRRVMRIMNRQLGTHLPLGAKFALAALAAAVVVVPVAAGFFNPTQLRAQSIVSDSAKSPALDSVTVKPDRSNDGHMWVQLNDNGLSMKGVTARQLIQMAYGVRDYQLSGGPDWLDTARFDVESRSSDPASQRDGQQPRIMSLTTMRAEKIQDETVATANGSPLPPGKHAEIFFLPREGSSPENTRMQAALRSVLSSRFNLQLRSESKVMPVYSLVAGDGPARLDPIQEQNDSGPVIRRDTMFQLGNGSLRLSEGKVGELAQQLSMLLGAPIIDKTGLTGKYNLNLTWNPSENQIDSVSSAVEEQLGLRLVPEQAPVPTWIIDRIDQPSEE